MQNHSEQRWDIFCRIVDNFGDIGVCWRLSQQLANAHQLPIRLFIDDPETAQKIIPGYQPELGPQTINRVEICSW
ncbi:MAG TPA: elongation factor P maturation arginine rhamnosyltransferase EarP, partial [Methylophilaceae bacterium]|nr:elongation factor P maturation arginine rhamnosyltransferase EarP [Methylophilaceae bacterium]